MYFFNKTTPANTQTSAPSLNKAGNVSSWNKFTVLDVSPNIDLQMFINPELGLQK